MNFNTARARRNGNPLKHNCCRGVCWSIELPGQDQLSPQESTRFPHGTRYGRESSIGHTRPFLEHKADCYTDDVDTHSIPRFRYSSVTYINHMGQNQQDTSEIGEGIREIAHPTSLIEE